MAASLLDASRPTFDRVEVMDGTELKSMTRVAFMGLELAVRIRLILAGHPRFFLGDEIVEKRDALALR